MAKQPEYNLRILGRLLSAGFSPVELKLLAFELDPVALNDDLAGLTKSEMVIQLIQFAYRQRRLGQMVAFIKRSNRTLYDDYENALLEPDQLDEAPDVDVTQTDPTNASNPSSNEGDRGGSINISGGKNVIIKGDVTGRDKLAGNQYNAGSSGRSSEGDLAEILHAINELLQQDGDG